MRASKLLANVSLFAAGFAAMTSAANAAAIVTFNDGAGGLAPGEVLIANFNPTTGGFTGSNANIYPGSVSGVAAEPATGDQGDAFLAVLAGGNALFSFAAPLTQFSFDYGSADTYNLLEIFYVGGGSESFTGQDVINVGTADGNQSAPRTNGRLTVNGNGGLISSFRVSSSQNSFELDNVATITAVPEPSIWALMILGFGIIGHSMRRRRISYKFAQAV